MRTGALKASPVGIKVWSDDEVERVEALLQHRQANLARAIQKGYHPAAVGRYEKEIEDAKHRLERLVSNRLRENDEIEERSRRTAQKEMETLLHQMKFALENRSVFKTRKRRV